ncbi:MAG: hypothetical protein KKI07_03070 [Euryarchaeota archaeon]|nr:hypothetical protein [Euryarchaeota archaeon]
MAYDDFEEDFEEEVELEEEIVGICDECSVEVDEADEAICPMCGAIYHEWCIKNVCSRCGTTLAEPE